MELPQMNPSRRSLVVLLADRLVLNEGMTAEQAWETAQRRYVEYDRLKLVMHNGEPDATDFTGGKAKKR